MSDERKPAREAPGAPDRPRPTRPGVYVPFLVLILVGFVFIGAAYFTEMPVFYLGAAVFLGGGFLFIVRHIDEVSPRADQRDGDPGDGPPLRGDAP